MRLLFFVLAAVCIGCCGDSGKFERFVKPTLPRDAKEVVDLGNDWVTFTIAINGKNHRFLYRYEYNGSVLTEISQ